MTLTPREITLAPDSIKCLIERKEQNGIGGRIEVMPRLMSCKLMHITMLNSTTIDSKFW